MDRRKSIKAIAFGTLSAGVLIEACKTPDSKPAPSTEAVEAAKANAAISGNLARQPEEIERDKKTASETFFTKEEMATITLLANIIIPKDEVSGSASDAKVPEFIEFIVKDMPENQTPMRGGLRWLDLQCDRQFGKGFAALSAEQQIQMVDQIAYPKKAKPEMAQGVAFFNLMRDLTLSGFYTTEMGVKDVGYMGNVPNQWKGVPDDVLKQYGLAYTDKENKECVTFD
jgi:hypothetical protein